MSFRRLSASAASCGRVVRRLERCSDEATKAELKRAESDWSDSRVVCEDWARDWGAEEVREARGRVERRFRYLAVAWSWTLGMGRGKAGVSKYGASSSYNGSAMTV